MPNPFRSSGQAKFRSSARTNINQGGGSKKAGFPYTTGRGYMTNHYFKYSADRSLPVMQMNMFPNARQSRPIGSTGSANYRYWHMPGTKM